MRPARRAAVAELATIGTLAAWNFGRLRVGDRVRIPANLATAATALGIAWAGGARGSDLGLDPARAAPGARLGFEVAVPVVAAVGVIVALPRTRHLLADEKIHATTRGEAAFETLVRIPFETAVAEELMFRGALVALGSRARSRRSALLTSSCCFGIWHVVPTLGSLARGAGGESLPAPASTVAVVAATTLAGAGLAWLRLRSDSIVAPIVVHAALNMSAFVAVRATRGRGRSQPGDAVAQQGEREQHDDDRGDGTRVANEPIAHLVEQTLRPVGGNEQTHDRRQQRQE